MKKDIDLKLKNLKEYCRFYKRCITSPETKKLLEKNKQFKDLYKGKRCFILGNGPSLKTEDLSTLRDEFVFTVNQSARLPQFKELKSNFHFWADENFFNIDRNKPEDMEMFASMLSVADDDPDIQCFFPVQAMHFIKDFEVDKKLTVNYFYHSLIFHDHFNKDIDYTKPVPGFGTVVQWCIIMAVYMGFSEIYLLGCDNTGIIVNIKSVCHENDDDDYGYTVSENEKKRMEFLLEKSNLEAYLRTYMMSVQDYRRLFRYCSDRNIKLVNCSSKTAVDSIPRKSLTEVLSGS